MTSVLIHVRCVGALKVLTKAHVCRLVAGARALILLLEVFCLSESLLLLDELLVLSAEVILMDRVDFL